jgi:hypothetical protein
MRGPATADYGGRVPTRFRYLAPDAAASLVRMLDAYDNRFVFTDLYRSAQGSREAYATKPGTQRPGYSAHGYGLAFDLDLSSTLHAASVSYAQLCEIVADYGWYCHRRDLDSSGSEAWHFNFLGPNAGRYLARIDPQDHGTWGRPVEARIMERWGTGFQLGPQAIAAGLAKASAADVRTFQREWGLAVDGVPGPITQRVLAFVTADLQIAPPASA